MAPPAKDDGVATPPEEGKKEMAEATPEEVTKPTSTEDPQQDLKVEGENVEGGTESSNIAEDGAAQETAEGGEAEPEGEADPDTAATGSAEENDEDEEVVIPDPEPDELPERPGTPKDLQEWMVSLAPPIWGRTESPHPWHGAHSGIPDPPLPRHRLKLFAQGAFSRRTPHHGAQMPTGKLSVLFS